jgi:hypothetical protein
MQKRRLKVNQDYNKSSIPAGGGGCVQSVLYSDHVSVAEETSSERASRLPPANYFDILLFLNIVLVYVVAKRHKSFRWWKLRLIENGKIHPCRAQRDITYRGWATLRRFILRKPPPPIKWRLNKRDALLSHHVFRSKPQRLRIRRSGDFTLHGVPIW